MKLGSAALNRGLVRLALLPTSKRITNYTNGRMMRIMNKNAIECNLADPHNFTYFQLWRYWLMSEFLRNRC